jgi:pyruvate dehydrogenase E2 component (dihydrolipoamide acetyltransferase)
MATMTEVRVPDIGDFDGVEIVEILVAEGDSVAAEDSLISLESDKATMEIPSPTAGVVRKLKVKLGEQVSEGDLVLLLEASEVADEAERVIPDEPAEQAGQKPDSSAPPAAAPAPPTPTPTPEAPPAVDRRHSAPPVSFDASQVMPDQAPHASPAVRKLAREFGVDLKEVRGSGRKNRILTEDVQGFVKGVMQRQGGGALAAGGGTGTGLNLLDWPKVNFSKFGPIEVQPLSRIQKISGANLARNWVMIPHVTQHDDADITEMEAFRKSHSEQAKEQGFKLTPLAFLMKACVGAMKQFPQFNASLDETGENLVLKQYFHIGVAVDTPDGLVVPVIRDCDQKSLYELGQDLAEVSARARDGKLAPKDMQGGCLSISSLGGIGGAAFTPIINAPEVAILGVSRSRMTAVWNGQEFEPRLMLPLSLSYDHRVIDGASAARFTSYLGHLLSDIRRLLL